MLRGNEKRHTGKCFDCDGALELIELDIQKKRKIMKCQNCFLLHYYKKDILSGWKLLKVTKKIDEQEK